MISQVKSQLVLESIIRSIQLVETEHTQIDVLLIINDLLHNILLLEPNSLSIETIKSFQTNEVLTECNGKLELFLLPCISILFGAYVAISKSLFILFNN